MAAGFATLGGARGMTGGPAHLYAIARAPATLVALLTALTPPLTVELAQLFLGESAGLHQRLGTALALPSIMLAVGGAAACRVAQALHRLFHEASSPRKSQRVKWPCFTPPISSGDTA